MYRITADVGGTFTDLALSGPAGELAIGKCPSTPSDRFAGVYRAIEQASEQLGVDTATVLAETSVFVYSTTVATNAILEHKTDPTALVVTKGFRDILRIRESGKDNSFDFQLKFPQPYIPIERTFEVPERILADGTVAMPIDAEALASVVADIKSVGISNIAVCLLWSFVNSAHERAVYDALKVQMPESMITLSHEIAPIAREYRRANATCIDASLKGLMSGHLLDIEASLVAKGFKGRLFGATISGGVLPIGELSSKPILSTGSGPALAPIAGRQYGREALRDADLIVCDMGGTSFDVSLVRGGEIQRTNETWLGSDRSTAHLVALSSVDVSSIGAGGGSIAWADSGGLLRVGPESSGSVPGPACYGKGGTSATVTDAAVVMGYMNPKIPLGETISIDLEAAKAAIGRLGDRFGMSVGDTADAVLSVAAEQMSGAIRAITVGEGIDPRESTIVAGGGASGLIISRIARTLGCTRVIVPFAAGTLSAVGGQYSDVISEFKQTFVTQSENFAREEVQSLLATLRSRAMEFAQSLQRSEELDFRLVASVSAKYPSQVWDIDVQLSESESQGVLDIDSLREAFYKDYARIYGIVDRSQPVEFLDWTITLHGHLPQPAQAAPRDSEGDRNAEDRQQIYSRGIGWRDVPSIDCRTTAVEKIVGPAILNLGTSTIVLDDGDVASTVNGPSLLIEINTGR